MSILEIASNGRVTIPAEMRKELHLNDGGVVLNAELVDGRIILTAARVVPVEEQQWLESDAVTQLLERADRNIAEGNVRRLTRSHLDDLRSARAIH